MRADNRKPEELREVSITRNYTHNNPGSTLIEFGNTRVLCHATITEGVPRFLRGSQQGWLSAEYSMLPSATIVRTQREAVKGKQTGRTQEIQRLIGRSLRSSLDLTRIKDYTINIDCDVIQADGGTRTASITGSSIALRDLIDIQLRKKVIRNNPIKYSIAAISVGIVKEEILLDLDYIEDSAADTDMNVIMTADGKYVEIQGTAEGNEFSQEQLISMLKYASDGINSLINIQKSIIQEPIPV